MFSVVFFVSAISTGQIIKPLPAPALSRENTCTSLRLIYHQADITDEREIARNKYLAISGYLSDVAGDPCAYEPEAQEEKLYERQYLVEVKLFLRPDRETVDIVQMDITDYSSGRSLVLLRRIMPPPTAVVAPPLYQLIIDMFVEALQSLCWNHSE